MADKTVGQLPALGAFGDDILIPVQDTGVAKRATGAQIKQFALDAVAPSVQEVEAIAAEMRQQAASPFLIAATAAAMTDRTKQDEELAAIKAEQALLTYGVLACLKGLKEQGCNGPVTEAINRIEKHINEKAHE